MKTISNDEKESRNRILKTRKVKKQTKKDKKEWKDTKNLRLLRKKYRIMKLFLSLSKENFVSHLAKKIQTEKRQNKDFKKP